MVLRGQGDSAVRICEPCKKLEEAARFEMRHGHKNRTGRGTLICFCQGLSQWGSDLYLFFLYLFCHMVHCMVCWTPKSTWSVILFTHLLFGGSLTASLICIMQFMLLFVNYLDTHCYALFWMAELLYKFLYKLCFLELLGFCNSPAQWLLYHLFYITN